MELACYDNPKFYNDFVWAMSEADAKALDVLSMVSSFLKCFTIVSGTTAIIVSINSVGLLIVSFGLVLEMFVQKRFNKLDYELSLKQKPL